MNLRSENPTLCIVEGQDNDKLLNGILPQSIFVYEKLRFTLKVMLPKIPIFVLAKTRRCTSSTLTLVLNDVVIYTLNNIRITIIVF